MERYWGGSAPDSGKCMCGLKRECTSKSAISSDNPCNCDAGQAHDDVFDDGYLMEKDRLPVKELHFGDTGTIADEKWGKHKLGPLRCYGDSEWQLYSLQAQCTEIAINAISTSYLIVLVFHK